MTLRSLHLSPLPYVHPYASTPDLLVLIFPCFSFHIPEQPFRPFAFPMCLYIFHSQNLHLCKVNDQVHCSKPYPLRGNSDLKKIYFHGWFGNWVSQSVVSISPLKLNCFSHFFIYIFYSFYSFLSLHRHLLALIVFPLDMKLLENGFPVLMQAAFQETFV